MLQCMNFTTLLLIDCRNPSPTTWQWYIHWSAIMASVVLQIDFILFCSYVHWILDVCSLLFSSFKFPVLSGNTVFYSVVIDAQVNWITETRYISLSISQCKFGFDISCIRAFIKKKLEISLCLSVSLCVCPVFLS